MDNFSLVVLVLSILIGIVVSITTFISFKIDKTKNHYNDDPEETLEKLRLEIRKLKKDKKELERRTMA
ncbi:MAG TPA: DUF1049 domain-containing protein [Thiotrichaceae bacterium]|nr:DUF1049 domain-containing protein [Thiotrichaceae bacterium]